MAAAFHELPLALFTALASMGAGAFVLLAVAFFTAGLSEEQLKRVDKLSVVPAAVVIVGFVAAFFHLANPLAALNVFNGVGHSPMSNELVVASLFAVVMVLYVALALAGKLKGMGRAVFALVVGVLAVVFALFMGLAYGIATIPTWSTPWPVVQMLGYLLLGGAALSAFVLSMAGYLADALKGGFKVPFVALGAAGLVLAVAGLALMVGGAGEQTNVAVSGADLVSGAMGCLFVALVCLVLGCVAVYMTTRGKSTAAFTAVAALVTFVGVLAGRFVFYALQISVGISF